MKNLIEVEQFSREELFGSIIPGIEKIIARARKMQNGRHKLPDNREKKLVVFSVEPSTRTIDSYLEAARLLGWTGHRNPPPENTSLKKDESWAETARTWAIQGANVIAMRTKIEGVQKFIAEILEEDGWDVSVQNCGDGEHEHPSQCLLDLITIKREKGRLNNLKIGFLGDLRFGRTVHSLIKALALSEKISLRLVSIPEMSLPKNYLEKFKGEIKSGEDLKLLRDCDVIYATRIQTERFPPEIQYAISGARKKYRLTKDILNGFSPKAIIMHPLPHADGFSPEAIKDKRVVKDRQSWYGIPTRMCLLNYGYKNRSDKKSPINNLPKGKMKTLISKNLSFYLEERKGRNKPRNYFLPIESGTVIDHLPCGFGAKIRNILEKNGFFTEKSVSHTIENVPSKKTGKKDVLVLDKVFLPNDTLISIASFVESTTFNIIKSGIFKKLMLGKNGVIERIGRCPNKNCITNNDPEAFARFLKTGNDGDGDMECHYCGRIFKNNELI